MDTGYCSTGTVGTSLKTRVPLDGSGCGACDGWSSRHSAHSRDLHMKEEERKKEEESEEDGEMD